MVPTHEFADVIGRRCTSETVYCEDKALISLRGHMSEIYSTSYPIRNFKIEVACDKREGRSTSALSQARRLNEGESGLRYSTFLAVESHTCTNIHMTARVIHELIQPRSGL